MKKVITTSLSALALAFSLCASQALATQNAPIVATQKLEVGVMRSYDFGDLKLHAYETKDALGDEVFLVETNTNLVLIELAPFKNNIAELKAYMTKLGKPLTDIIVAYHPAGNAYEGAQIHASEGLGEAGLVARFTQTFGDAFDGSMPQKFELVKEGEATVGGVKFSVIKTRDAFDLEIPQINVFVAHMIGDHTHNILTNLADIDEMIALMKKIDEKKYVLVLTGHDTPKNANIAAQKLEYLQTIKTLALATKSADEFKAAVKEAFPDYAGDYYLDLSAAALFK